MPTPHKDEEPARHDGAILEKTDRSNLPPARGLQQDAALHVHVMPQSHIDLVWYWAPSEAVRMVLHTFRGHIRLLEKNPSYTFVQSQAWAYDVVRKEDPALFKRLQALVAAGRWEPAGGEWVEADPALPGPEARIRQFLIGQRFFLEHFDRISSTGWCPDGFTMMPASLPQMFLGSGMRFLFHKRPRERYGRLPVTPYRWQGSDQTEMLAYRTNNKGCGLPLLSEGQKAPEDRSDLAVIAEAFGRVGLADLWGPLGVGDTGGVNRYALPEPVGSVTFAYSTPETFFARLDAAGKKDSLPVISGSLPPAFTGCLTTWARVKGLNRRAEAALQQAEFLVALARMLDIKVTDGKMEDNWKQLLFLHFHDSIAGCGTEPICALIEREYENILDDTKAVSERAMRAMSEHLFGPNDQGVPVGVFNPLGWQRDTVVNCRIGLPGDWGDMVPLNHPDAASYTVLCPDYRNPGHMLEAVDDQGRTTPVHIAAHAQYQDVWIAHVRFLARDVPPFGYRRILVRKAARRPASRPDYEDNVHCTDRLRVTFDADRGAVRSIACRDTGHITGAPTLGALAVHETGHYQINYGKELRAWEAGLTGKVSRLRPTRMLKTEYSGDRQAVVFHYEYGASTFEQEFLLEPDADYVEVRVRGQWKEVEKYLKIHFALESEASPVAFADMAYGMTECLPEGYEYPMQYFCGLRSDRNGLLVVNNGRYGCLWQQGSLSLSAIRCATYPAKISDQGAFELSYRIIAFNAASARWRTEVFQRGFDMNIPAVAYGLDATPDREPSLPPAGGLLEKDPVGVLPTCLKCGHDDGVVVRCFNADAVSRNGRLTPCRACRMAGETDLLERALPAQRESPPDAFRPWGLRTFKLKRDDRNTSCTLSNEDEASAVSG